MEEEGIFLKIFCQDLITFIPASQAYALLDIYEGSFVLAMLNFLRTHQISKPSAFKVLSASSHLLKPSLPLQYFQVQVVLGVQKLIESTLIDLNSTLAHWRCLQPEYQALNGVITCKVTRIESDNYQARARARRACALRALGLLLADGTPTVGGGKTF